MICNTKLGRCMDTKATESEVKQNLDEGQAVGVGGTPTLFINGRKIDHTIDWPSLRAMIEHELDYQKTAKDAGEDCGCDVKLNLPGMQNAAPPVILPVKPPVPPAKKK